MRADDVADRNFTSLTEHMSVPAMRSGGGGEHCDGGDTVEHDDDGDDADDQHNGDGGGTAKMLSHGSPSSPSSQSSCDLLDE